MKKCLVYYAYTYANFTISISLDFFFFVIHAYCILMIAFNKQNMFNSAW